jgi:hypothetical protein
MPPRSASKPLVFEKIKKKTDFGATSGQKSVFSDFLKK